MTDINAEIEKDLQDIGIEPVFFYIDETDLPEGVDRETFEEEFFTDWSYYPQASV